MKIARQYFVERGEKERHHIIARRQSYHGNTLAALAAGGNMWRRQQYLPLLIETHHISPCYEYRGRRADESAAEYGARVADELEQKIEELGPSSVMAFIAEPVVGATLGAVPSVPGYFNRIREICDRHGVLLILDEVMCGMGRCGTRFAFEHEGIVPDIVCVAKGLGAGYQPIGAMLVEDRIVEAIREGTGFFQHGYTYIGHAAACAGALAVQKVIEKRELLKRVNPLGNELKSRLEARFGNHPFVGDIRGRGLFIGIELVEDRMTKEPFDPSLAVNGKIKAAAMEQGLMCYPMGGTIDGRRGDHIVIAPPYIIERAPHRRDRRQAFDRLRSRLPGRLLTLEGATLMTPPKGLEGGLTNYGDPAFSAYLRRSFARSMGYSRELLGKPIIGITATASGFNNCHRGVPELIEAVKRGVLAAGGLPLEFR